MKITNWTVVIRLQHSDNAAFTRAQALAFSTTSPEGFPSHPLTAVGAPNQPDVHSVLPEGRRLGPRLATLGHIVPH